MCLYVSMLKYSMQIKTMAFGKKSANIYSNENEKDTGCA